MYKECFDRQWKFTLNGKSRTVDVPHDYSIEQKRSPDARGGAANGFFLCGTAEYAKTFHVPDAWRDKTVYMEFEGVYMNALVRLNGQIIAQHPYGYTGFHCVLNPYLQYGADNTITVQVHNDALPNTRWYSGSGIYRHVWLSVAEPLHIAPEGVFVTTPDVTCANIQTTVKRPAHHPAAVTVHTTVIDANGNSVAVCETLCPDGQDTVESRVAIPDAALWSPDHPNLYTARTSLFADGVQTDSVDTVFGVRTIAFDVVNGFRLNGQPMKMKGGCVHHDCGLLGAAAFDRAEERKVELLKESGFNAVRCAHNPPSPAFLDACDRLGMLVMDEAFDAWREPKNPYDYSLYFEDWWKRDMAAMVLRDRNHPSIILWSTGNEILERDGRSDGYRIARELADFVRSLDHTRPVTNALCSIWDDVMLTADSKDKDAAFAPLTKDFAAPLDVVGYNYLRDHYEKDGTLFPERVIIGTETVAKEAFEYWSLVEKLPYVVGDFIWTSLDYLGEAGIGRGWHGDTDPSGHMGMYPWHQAYCGDIDICGFKRPQSFYRDFVWGIGKQPYIAVHKPQYHGMSEHISFWGWPDVAHNWTWPGFEGKTVQIDVYAAGDEAELLLNGVSLGRKPAGKGNRYTSSFETTYAPGELVAVSYENGVETTRTTLRTTGAPATIRLTADRTVLKATYGDLSFIAAEILDAVGNVVYHADVELHGTVSGAGALQAVGNGNPVSEESYVGNVRRVHEGRAMVVVKTTGEPGPIVLTVSAEGLPTVTVEMHAE